MKKTFMYIIVSFFSIASSGLLANQEVQSDQKALVQPEPMQQSQIIKPKVAIIYLFNQIDFKQVTLNLVEAAKSNEIHGILLVIHNHGGAADIFSALHDLIKKITTMKPVVSLVVGSALSGGYMLASATDYIIAHSCSEIGSIGVINIIQKYKDPRINGLVDAKLEVEVFQAGKFKALYNNYTKDLSEDDRKYIKEELNKYYKQLLQIITKNRNLDVKKYKEWAEGKTFIAPEALQLKLIDEIGTIFEAESKVHELISKRNQHYVFDKDIAFHFYEEDQKEQAKIEVS